MTGQYGHLAPADVAAESLTDPGLSSTDPATTVSTPTKLNHASEHLVLTKYTEEIRSDYTVYQALVKFLYASDEGQSVVGSVLFS